MDINIHHTFVPHSDPDESMAFYRDVLGFEVVNDVGYGGMRWITLAPPAGGPTTVVLHPPTADPGITAEEGRVVAEMMAKGTFASIVLATPDVDATFEQAAAAGADVVQEPLDQDWGVRDCALRDPAGNMVRIQQVG